MVSTRPPPNPARGRVAYPTAANYIPGDANASPVYLGAPLPMKKTSSRDSDKERAQGLKTWWKSFRERETVSHRQPLHSQGVFGVPLQVSIVYASVQVTIKDEENGSLYVAGVVPTAIGKCGLFLKERATTVEGTFRVSGSAKRMRELQLLFDTGPDYGKDVNFNELPYTTHDVATIFRRFLCQMPEPIVPFIHYKAFRLVMEKIHSLESSVEQAVSEYKHLINSLPEHNRFLLLYVLDLLGLFARRSDQNLMTDANLALIFQPGILAHPTHSMQPSENVLSQQVLEFLIQNDHHILKDMRLPRIKKNKNITREKTKQKMRKSPIPPLVRADTDLMPPSDSDDDMPAEGYYVFESSFGQTSQTRRKEPTSLNVHLGKTSAPAPQSPVIRNPVKPQQKMLEPSDSDEDAPSGGYEIRTCDFEGTRSKLLTNNDRRGGEKGTGLARRKTLPARAGAGLGLRIPRIGRVSREAP
nr:hypothetical protein L203_01117 [Cryptococcus depauperatus CBS 7841]